MKTCTKCKIEYPATTEFFTAHSDRGGRLRSVCRTCSNKSSTARMANKRAADPAFRASQNASAKRWHSAHLDARACEHRPYRRNCSICSPVTHYHQYALNDKKTNGGELPADFMSYKEFYIAVQQRCHWCRLTPEQCSGMGVDRRDNDLLHTSGNIEPCCTPCNHMRGDMSYEDFGNWCLTIAARFNVE